MPEQPKTKPAAENSSAQSFVGSVLGFSVSTYINFGITALALLLTSFLVTDKAVINYMKIFTDATNLLMAVGILGLDQSLIRFFHEPPAGLSSKGLMRVCFYFSAGFLLLGGGVSFLLARRVLPLLALPGDFGLYLLPLLFLNALFWAVARYFNVLLRMEQRLLAFSVQSILMNFFFRLFYLGGAFFKNQFAAMVLFSLCGLGGLAVVFGFLYRRTLRPQLSEFAPAVLRPALKEILPYGLYTAPATVILYLNAVLAQVVIAGLAGASDAGVYGFAAFLANIVTTVQAGFSTFWGAYMFANYQTQQERIKKVHDFLNFIILAFFCALVAAEDIIFFILRNNAGSQPLLPLMMLAAVFAILCEGTVYGIAIAKKPVYDTLGFALALALNVGLCFLLVPPFGIAGAALALAAANFAMFLFRTVIAQKFYRTIRSPGKTAAALLVACAVAAAGTVWAGAFWPRFIAAVAGLVFYCLFYRAEFVRFIKLLLGFVSALFSRAKK